jgi:hypothetical protein
MATSQYVLDKINAIFKQYATDFKNIICDGINNKRTNDAIIQKINDYSFPLITTNDMNKKKRTKNNIPICERCEAKRASGERCSRRKKGSSIYCGTHIKGTPHGKINDKQTSLKKVETINKDINGIIYCIDKHGNVYDNEDILFGKPNPKILTKYTGSWDSDDIVINI